MAFGGGRSPRVPCFNRGTLAVQGRQHHQAILLRGEHRQHAQGKLHYSECLYTLSWKGRQQAHQTETESLPFSLNNNNNNDDNDDDNDDDDNDDASSLCSKAVLEVKSETQLRNLSEKLQQQGIKHKLWIEQPENYATCLATAPLPKATMYPILKKYNLCKASIGQK